jgi:hypothetical protein
MATNSEKVALDMLKKIDSKLDALIERLSIFTRPRDAFEPRGPAPEGTRLSDRAEQVAALTPAAIQQTDSVELLHQDRAR